MFVTCLLVVCLFVLSVEEVTGVVAIFFFSLISWLTREVFFSSLSSQAGVRGSTYGVGGGALHLWSRRCYPSTYVVGGVTPPLM